jgi:hypothetical protein
MLYDESLRNRSIASLGEGGERSDLDSSVGGDVGGCFDPQLPWLCVSVAKKKDDPAHASFDAPEQPDDAHSGSGMYEFRFGDGSAAECGARAVEAREAAASLSAPPFPPRSPGVGRLRNSCLAAWLDVVLRGVSVSRGRGVDVGDMLMTDRFPGDSSACRCRARLLPPRPGEAI